MIQRGIAVVGFAVAGVLFAYHLPCEGVALLCFTLACLWAVDR